MKITRIETLHCDAGWRPWSFIKIETDEDITGWSETTDSHGSQRGMEGIVRDLEPLLLGRDPRPVERIYQDLYRQTRQTPYGLIQKALGGIENALLDIKAKALGVPVYELFGGPLRDSLRLYWSHCGTTRARAWKVTGNKPLRSYEDVAELGSEVAERGFTALKTNIVVPSENPSVYMPGFGGGLGTTDQTASREILTAIEKLISAFRKGAGPDIDICLDLNFNFKPEGCVRVAKAIEQHDLFWLETDIFDPLALRMVKDKCSMPICSGENLYTTRQFLPFFTCHAMDTASVDVIWNGLSQSKKISDLAEIHEINVAPHNYYGHLATMIGAHFCAIVPNLRIFETDVDDVPWKDELVTAVPEIENGHMKLPTAPGWGADINEDVLRAHPWPKG